MDQIERLADAGQHAQRQHIDFHDAQRVQIVLVPFDEIAVVHRGRADGHDGVEIILGQHKAADMLGEMAGKADQLVGEMHRLRHRGHCRDRAGPGAPDVLSVRRHDGPRRCPPAGR